MADLVVRDYFAQNGDKSQTSVVSFDAPASNPVPPLAPENSNAPAPGPRPAPAPAPADPISAPQTSLPVESQITEAKVHQAGFKGAFTEKHFDGKIFQLIDITKTPVESIGFYEVAQDVGTVASIVAISLKDEIRALQLYRLLQNKTKTYIDLSLNETNAYGDRSFYINHAKKPDEAFLTIKVGKTIYAFAYVKFYHPEIKNLIQLLTQ